MITFARGLVLRRGERTLEFERDLGNGDVQFKFLDTFEVKTFALAKIYREVLEGICQEVRSANAVVTTTREIDEPQVTVLPSRLDAVQEARIAFRMHYIKAAIRMRAQYGSFQQCAEVIAVTPRPAALDGGEEDMFKAFHTPKTDTLMRWLKLYHLSGANPFFLCDRRPLVVRRKRLNSLVERIVDDAIVKHYLQLYGKSMRETCSQACLMVQAANRSNGSSLPLPSEKTVARRIAEIPLFVQDSKRRGPAYARNKWRYSLAGDQSTRTLERAEIDHTLLDLWVLDPRSGVPLGRPWITVIIDRMSGYILGVYISFYGPSSATVASALKVAILPKDEILEAIPEIKVPWTAMGVAETYVVDNGLEFHARTFRRIAWDLRADLLYNPVRQPWLKSSIERSMMEFNRMLPNRGKVFAPIKNAQPPDPQKSAAILFDDLCSSVIQWAAEVHPRRIHPKTLVRPIDLWEEGRQSGPPPMLPSDLKQLELATGISTQRTIGGDGVFFQYLRYNSPELQDYCRGHGRTFRTEVRFNPDNLGLMHVHLPKAQDWLAVPLQRPSLDYGSGLSLLQHQINRVEAGKRLTRANAEEELLLADQRNKDRWGEAIRRGVRVRKHSDLIRQQGLTSGQFMLGKCEQSTPVALIPEVSPRTMELLPKLIPYAGYSLDEDME